MGAYRYRNNGGQHVFLDNTVVEHGETFVCDDPDLMTKFPQKFTRVYDEPTPAEKTPVQEAAEKGAAGAAPKKAIPEFKDVTDEFPEAGKADLRVLKNKAGWWLYDDDDDPVNEKALKKKEVAEAIAVFVTED